jgi:hypothetical protein
MKRLSLTLASVLVVVGTSRAQVLFNPNTGYTQNFDSLASPPPGTHTWSNNSTLTGWYAADQNGLITQYYANDGSSAVGGLYSYGNSGDRALGSQASNSTGEMYWGAQFTNNHPAWVLTSFTASYRFEQWRDASEDQSTTFFEYSMDATSIDDAGATWVPVPAGDLVSIQNSNSGALDGNNVFKNLTVAVNGINWAPGTSLWIRWVDPNDPGSDHGLAIDDFSLAAVPEPTTMALVGLGMGAIGLVTRRLQRKRLNLAA